jgi:hypothetical protein
MDLLKAKELCLELMTKHGLTSENGWSFEWIKSKNSAGKCRTFNSVKIVGFTTTGRKIKTSTNSTNGGIIMLSSFITSIHNEDEVKDTILHEIAHGLTPGHNHDSVWRRKALEIGCNGERCFSITEEIEEKKSNIVGICPKCNKKHYMVRIPKTNRWCMCTNRTFIAEEKIQWTTKSNLVVDKTTNITRRRLH